MGSLPLVSLACVLARLPPFPARHKALCLHHSLRGHGSCHPPPELTFPRQRLCLVARSLDVRGCPVSTDGRSGDVLPVIGLPSPQL